jgi:hypothetical protein
MRRVDHTTALLVLLIAGLSIFGVIVRAEEPGWTMNVDAGTPIPSLLVLSMTKRSLPVPPVSQWKTLYVKKDRQEASVWNTSGPTHVANIPLARRRCRGTPTT